MEKNQDVLDAMRSKLLELEAKAERLADQKAQLKTQITGFEMRAEVLVESGRGLERERKGIEAKVVENETMLTDTESRIAKLKAYIDALPVAGREATGAAPKK